MSEEGDDVDLDSLTVEQLKERLRDASLSTTGKKADLLARLKGAMPPKVTRQILRLVNMC
jgi:hypothetical protein